jgi:hypothetical protein
MTFRTSAALPRCSLCGAELEIARSYYAIDGSLRCEPCWSRTQWLAEPEPAPEVWGRLLSWIIRRVRGDRF